MTFSSLETRLIASVARDAEQSGQVIQQWPVRVEVVGAATGWLLGFFVGPDLRVTSSTFAPLRTFLMMFGRMAASWKRFQ